MIILKEILSLILMTSCIALNQSRPLVGTTWKLDIFMCQYELKFFDENRFSKYYCDIGRYRSGTFEIKSDTLVLNHILDSSIPLNDSSKVIAIYKYRFISDNELALHSYLNFNPSKYEYLNSQFETPNDWLYKREK